MTPTAATSTPTANQVMALSLKENTEFFFPTPDWWSSPSRITVTDSSLSSHSKEKLSTTPGRNKNKRSLLRCYLFYFIFIHFFTEICIFSRRHVCNETGHVASKVTGKEFWELDFSNYLMSTSVIYINVISWCWYLYLILMSVFLSDICICYWYHCLIMTSVLDTDARHWQQNLIFTPIFWFWYQDWMLTLRFDIDISILCWHKYFILQSVFNI